MTTAGNPNRSQNLTDLQVDVGVIKNQIQAIVKQGERQEKQGERQEEKIDLMKQTLDSLSVISRREFDDFKDSVDARFVNLDKIYVRNDRIKGIQAIGIGVAVAVLAALVIGVIKVVGSRL